MQPLYSVDHETRQNSSRREEGNPNTNEDTPLLRRFPSFRSGEPRPWNLGTILIVIGLLSMLVLGVVIGTDLLVILNNSENILPPVETPLQLVSRSQWDPSAVSRPLSVSPLQASQVVVLQTDTAECENTETCSSLLQKMQVIYTSNCQIRQEECQMNSTSEMQYNFLVSTNGQTYEALGWHRPSPMFSQHAGAMVLAFIGNFTVIGPKQKQIDEAKNFFAESMSQRHLLPHFDIIGKNTTYKPEMLFEALKPLPQWNEELSDA